MREPFSAGLDRHRASEQPKDIPAATRAEVLERDNHQCQVCGTHRNLHLHHWWQFRSQGGGHEPWNLVTVCADDHDRIHSHLIDIELHEVRGIWRAFVTRRKR